MRFLVIFCHPSKDSFNAALYKNTSEALLKSGHELKVVDLYGEGFDPVLSSEEWESYLDDTEKNVEKVKKHIDYLTWAEGLIFIFPTWMYGPPAILKGWLERVWLPTVAFEIPRGKQKRAQGKLRNIKRFCVVTTSGSPFWWLWFIGNPAKSMLFKGYKILFNRHCKLKWLQLHNMNHTSETDRKVFINKVFKYFSNIE